MGEKGCFKEVSSFQSIPEEGLVPLYIGLEESTSIYLELAVASIRWTSDVLRGYDLSRPEGHLVGVVIEHRVRGVGTGGERGLWTTIPGAWGVFKTYCNSSRGSKVCTHC